MKALVISMRALALGLLVVAGGDCGGGGLPGAVDGGPGGTGGIRNAGAGGTAGQLDAAVDRDAADVSTDARQDTSDVATDRSAPEAGDARGDGPAIGQEILCPRPTRALITDFTFVPGDGGTTTEVPFGNGQGFSGTEYVYPIDLAWPLTSDVTGNNWHISGAVGTYSGFGLAFAGCNRLDASAYRGISFTISGSVPQGGAITMGIPTLNDTIAAAWLNTHGEPDAVNLGSCIPAAGATNKFTQTSCADPIATIQITTIPTVRTVLWSDFSGGRPEAAVSPADILSVYWFLPVPPGAGTATPTTYPVDIVIDDLSFIP